VRSNEKAIGIFDSGVGGLTVAKQIFKKLPFENMIYFGDTARTPYGPRSPGIVRKFSVQNISFLSTQGVKLIVVACNTASAVALEYLKKIFQLPLMGVIEPGSNAAVKVTKNGRIGVIGTAGTIRSDSYSKAIQKIDKLIKVFGYPCPLFVSLAEEGYIDKKATYLIAEEYLAPLKKQKIDTLVLGCTHYPLLKKVISRVMGDKVTLIDSAEETALEVKRILEENDSLNTSKTEPCYKFYVSDFPEKFIQISKRFLGEKIKEVKKIDINKY
jgi:glutamate racemase